MRATMGPRPDPAPGRFPAERGLPPAPAVGVPGSKTWGDSYFETCSKTEESLP
ncbi:hypothetical protein [Streptomyces neyagawaensis]|uniref:hypothetical protein n=1 Tax=Streptomyces neyagawaensis TaxID=42238 RepID=UPI000A6184A3|nr:hypothetical protein [Streptomyces neyagawaensis]MCL6735404.1 hypothetical protein [Streptomyces neyagawaensis]MDE1682669.1 hypothetical protein [Streptomyces neyagawaensis]